MGEYATQKYGVLPRQRILKAFNAGLLTSDSDPKPYIQPSSLDIPLGERVIRLRAAFLPEDHIGSVEENIKELSREEFYLGTLKPKTLDRGQTYLIELDIGADLPDGLIGPFNPKSTTGRADCLTRVIVDGVRNYDTITPGAKRKCWVEITPLSWNVQVTKGLALNQLRLHYGENPVDELALKMEYMKRPLLLDPENRPIELKTTRFKKGGLELTVDLEADIVGYRAKINSSVEFDLSAGKGELAEEKAKFFEPIERPRNGKLILEKDVFYLLGTYEKAFIPEDLCGTLMAYDVTSAEGRAHYAGFFDSGFFACATLEMRIRDAPFTIKHRQPICVLQYDHMLEVPCDEKGERALYAGNYQGQPRGPNLPKQFVVKTEETGSLR
ncbi:2'-deoxycytidine 5'-triphosphate deaminase [Candidatus Woesearchaeota archaeon]|nr:2'-deoxycytidine 5'-triphosphate deaminase [Candidatus Woesearchaeota archaeon]